MSDEVRTGDGPPGDPGSPAPETDDVSRVEALRSRARIGKFISVGLIGAVFDTTVFFLLVEVIEVNLVEEVAALAGIEAAILVMFVINDQWTFAEEGADDNHSLFYRFAKSNAVRAVGTVTHLAVFSIVFRVFFLPISIAGIGIWGIVAKGTGILSGGVVNYIAESLITWRVHVDS